MSCSCGDLVADLNTFQKSISAGLETIWRINNGTHSDIERLAAQGWAVDPRGFEVV